MYERVFRLPAIVLLSLLISVSMASAWARGGGGGVAGGGRASGAVGGHGAGATGGHGAGMAGARGAGMAGGRGAGIAVGRGVGFVHGAGGGHGSGTFRAPTASVIPAFQLGIQAGLLRPPVRGGLGAPPIVPRQINVADELRRRGRGPFENGFPIGAWTYWPYIDTVSSQAPAAPTVIVASAAPTPASQQKPSDQLPDYSYIPGCHAIPNGYHCDTTQKPAASP
jgi:hypothetical protein